MPERQLATHAEQVLAFAAGLITHLVAAEGAPRQDKGAGLMPARAAGGGEDFLGALLQQVLHKGGALFQRDDDAHAEQLAAGILATATEHFHGNDPFLDAAVGAQAQQASLAAVIAVGGSRCDGHRAGDPFINDRAVVGVVVGVVFILTGRPFETVAVHARTQLAAFLIGHPVLVHRPARALRRNGRRIRPKADDVAVRQGHGRVSNWRGR
ncbi:hypothetical protein D3C86_1469810 [compost metagenome]